MVVEVRSVYIHVLYMHAESHIWYCNMYMYVLCAGGGGLWRPPHTTSLEIVSSTSRVLTTK